MAVTTARTAARRLAPRAAVVVTTAAVVAVAAVPDVNRFVLVLGVLAMAAALVTAVRPWRLVGSVTVLAATLTALLAGTLDVSSARPAQEVTVAALLLALVAALGGCEDTGTRSDHAAVVGTRPLAARVLPGVIALVAGALVAVAAAQDVGASFPLVIAGLAAAVIALLVAASAHRS